MTIAQQIKWDFKTNGDLVIRDKKGKIIYWEDADGYWAKWECDSQGNQTYYHDSDGYWSKREWDSQGNQIYYENSNGFWAKYEYDSQDNKIYYENSDGLIKDKRPKSCEGKEIVIDGEKFKLVKV